MWWFLEGSVQSLGTLKGTTISCNLNLNFIQAALGDTVDIPAVHSDVDVRPQTGREFRRGKGSSEGLRGGAVGDQYVTVNVAPTKLNDRQKQQEFAAAGDLSQSKKKGFFDIMNTLMENKVKRAVGFLIIIFKTFSK